MNFDALIDDLKKNALSGLEQHVFDQATKDDLVDTVLKALVEAAVEKLDIKLPFGKEAGGAVMDILGSLSGVLATTGLDQQLVKLIQSSGVDQSLRDSIIKGITRYLDENGARLMKVALDAVVGKLTR